MRTLLTIGRIVIIVATNACLSIIALLSLLVEKDGRTYFWAGSTWSKLCLKIYGIDVRVRGMENIHPDRCVHFCHEPRKHVRYSGGDVGIAARTDSCSKRNCRMYLSGAGHYGGGIILWLTERKEARR